MKKIFLIIIILISTISCLKDDDGTDEPLPSISFEGKNTFGCIIDGETFLPRKETGGIFNNSDIIVAKYYYETYYTDEGYRLHISAHNELTKKNVIIELYHGTEALEEGITYDFQPQNPNVIVGRYSTLNNHPNNPNYSADYTTTENSGKLTIMKLDTINNIISGTFRFDALDYFGNSSKIKNGRFDLIYELN